MPRLHVTDRKARDLRRLCGGERKAVARQVMAPCVGERTDSRGVTDLNYTVMSPRQRPAYFNESISTNAFQRTHFNEFNANRSPP